MKAGAGSSQNRGFTLLELLVVSALLLILLAMLLPLGHRPGRPATIPRCMNNLRQIGLAMHMFAEDNTGKFPAQSMVTNAAPAELLDSQGPANYFVPLSQYVKPLKVWVCPTDKLKVPAANYTQFNNSNVSYFLSLSATGVVSGVILAGDRHLTKDGKAIGRGVFSLTTNSRIGWSRELHPAFKPPRGCLVFADDHAESLGTKVADLFREQAPERLTVP